MICFGVTNLCMAVRFSDYRSYFRGRGQERGILKVEVIMRRNVMLASYKILLFNNHDQNFAVLREM
jgi:hypothetical protein